MYNSRMDIQNRILQSIRPRRDGLLLRFDVKGLGSSSQVSAALTKLCRNGQIQRIERGVYVSPSKLASLGKTALLERAHERRMQALHKMKMQKRRRARITPTARHVNALAKRLGVSYTPTFSDRWAVAVTRLAGDEVCSDATDDLLVALTRAGKLSPTDMAKLVMEHHRTLKAHV
jgi:hypothetical protein